MNYKKYAFKDNPHIRNEDQEVANLLPPTVTTAEEKSPQIVPKLVHLGKYFFFIFVLTLV